MKKYRMMMKRSGDALSAVIALGIRERANQLVSKKSEKISKNIWRKSKNPRRSGDALSQVIAASVIGDGER